MVVGNGLIARSFAEFKENDQVIIFASGVSNSLLTDSSAYQREFDLIDQMCRGKRLFVYFSTISVLAPCMQDNIYVQFKKKIEQFISDTSENFVIFRLPNLVGHSDNPHTLTNFLYQRIISGTHFDVHRNATRYLLDVDHMVQICIYFLKHYPQKTMYDIVLNNKASMQEIVRDFESVLHLSANYTVVEKGCDSDISPIAQSILEHIHFIPQSQSSYNQWLLKKYYGRTTSAY